MRPYGYGFDGAAERCRGLGCPQISPIFPQEWGLGGLKRLLSAHGAQFIGYWQRWLSVGWLEWQLGQGAVTFGD